MSFLKDKLGRSAVVVAFSLGAFQALSIVGATSASAAIPATATCTTAGGVVTVSVPDDSSFVAVWEDTNGGIHASASTTQATLVLGGANDIPANGTFTGCTGVQAGVATTTAINITGGSGLAATDQHVTIEMAKWVSNNPAVATLPGAGLQATANWGAINWTVNLGADGAVGDSLRVNDSNTQVQAVFDVNAGVNGIDLNNDGDLDVTTAGVEAYSFSLANLTTLAAQISLADNTIDLNGSTITGGPFPVGSTITDTGAALTIQTLSGGAGNDVVTGGASDDWISPGLGSDGVVCAGGEDTLDYSNTATAINVNLPSNTVTQGTDLDSLDGVAGTSNCEDVVGTAEGDTITGDTHANWIAPGDGNDIVAGGTGEDTYDVSDAADGVTVDLGAGTSTGGSGTDTLSAIEDVNGSDSDDSLTGASSGASADNILWGNGGNDTLSGGAGDGDGDDTFDGGSGIDTVNYGDNTLNTTVALSCLPATTCVLNPATGNVDGVDGNGTSLEDDIITNNTVENATLGSGDDFFTGSTFNNIVFPNGGQNSLEGGDGIDTVNYSTGYTAGITINLSGGGASGGGQDSIGGFENAVGTAFNDQMFGTDLVAATNGANLLVGGKGNDTISANAGPDFVRGGAGNDRVRGGSGDDTLKGQGGKDNIRGGTGDDDIFGGKGKDTCIGGGGHDLIKTCEKPRHHHHGPNGPGVAHLARLSALKP